MKIEHLVSVLLRLLVIYLLFSNVLIKDNSLYSVALVAPEQIYKMQVFRVVLAYLLVLVLVWVFSDRIARFVTKENSGDVIISISSPEKLEALCFALLGVLICVSGVADLIQKYVSVGRFELKRQIILIGPIVRIVLGVWLIFKAEGFAHLLTRLRGFR